MLRPARPLEKFLWHPLQAAAAFAFYAAFRILPLDAASAVGGWIGRALGPRLGLTDRARRNVRLAFPDLDDGGVEQVIRGMWDNLGRTVGEFPHLGAFDFGGPEARVEVEGFENFAALRDDGVGGIFFSSHLANWELGPAFAAFNGLELDMIYREANNRLVERLYMRGRRVFSGALIPKGASGARAVLTSLKRGRHVALMVDQKMNDGIAAPFFGRDAMTAPALGEFARHFDCPVSGVQVIRKRGARFKIRLTAPIRAQRSDDKAADVLDMTTRVNSQIEDWIRENPSQWLWLHNRWPD